MPTVLEAKFHEAILRIYEDQKHARPEAASRLRDLIVSQGGVQAAKTILSRTPTQEFPELFLAKRLDLTIEALVVREPWRQLFTADELETAQRRIDEVESGGGT